MTLFVNVMDLIVIGLVIVGMVAVAVLDYLNTHKKKGE